MCVGSDSDLMASRNCTAEQDLASAKYTVGTGSRHLSVSQLSPATNDLLMTYEDPSEKLNVMHGSEEFGWRNVTENLEASIEGGIGPAEYTVSACSTAIMISTVGYIYCFVYEGSVSGVYGIDFDASQGDFTFTNGKIFAQPLLAYVIMNAN